METVLTPKARIRKRAVPRLHSGDRLTQEEFHRRYEAMGDGVKYELINGVVYMASPVRVEEHGSQSTAVIGWLFVYQANTPGVQAADNSTVILDTLREPQPDALLRLLPEFGGQTRTTDKGYIAGGPELTAEISGSSISIDLRDKLDDYRRNRVREYIVWRVEDDTIDWFVLRGEQYERLPLSPEGWYRSEVFPGLWLDPAAMIRGDMRKVLEVLQQGLASPEHAAFVALSQKRHAPPQEPR